MQASSMIPVLCTRVAGEYRKHRVYARYASTFATWRTRVEVAQDEAAENVEFLWQVWVEFERENTNMVVSYKIILVEDRR